MIINAESMRRVYGEPKPLWWPPTEAEKFHAEMEKMESDKRKFAAWAHREGVIINFIFIGTPVLMVCHYWAMYFILVDFNPLRALGCLAEMMLFYVLLADGERV